MMVTVLKDHGTATQSFMCSAGGLDRRLSSQHILTRTLPSLLTPQISFAHTYFRLLWTAPGSTVVSSSGSLRSHSICSRTSRPSCICSGHWLARSSTSPSADSATINPRYRIRWCRCHSSGRSSRCCVHSLWISVAATIKSTRVARLGTDKTLVLLRIDPTALLFTLLLPALFGAICKFTQQRTRCYTYITPTEQKSLHRLGLLYMVN